MIENCQLCCGGRRVSFDSGYSNSIFPFLAHSNIFNVGLDVAVQVDTALKFVQKLPPDSIQGNTALEPFVLGDNHRTVRPYFRNWVANSYRTVYGRLVEAAEVASSRIGRAFDEI